MSLSYACQKWSRSPEQGEQNHVHAQNKTSQTKVQDLGVPPSVYVLMVYNDAFSVTM